MKRITFFVLMAFFSLTSYGNVLTKEQTTAYERRRFILLDHLLVSNHQFSLVSKIHDQERDLVGCRELHRGKGGLTAVLSCIDFLNREQGLGLRPTEHRMATESLVKDINILCGKLADGPQALKKLLGHNFLDPYQKRWTACIEGTWKQVYLTAYANFDADPVHVLALVRAARRSLPAHSGWATKVNSLLRQR